MKKNILLLFMGLASILNAQEICLNIPEVKQQLDKWCWVASSQCVLWYFGNLTSKQCDIAEYVRQQNVAQYGTTQCCDKPNPSHGCNKEAPIDGNAGVQGILKSFGNISSFVDKDIWATEISYYLGKNRPLIIRRWNNWSYTAHAWVIYGINNAGDFVNVMCPVYGFDKVSYSSLNGGYFLWTHTLVTNTLPPPPPPPTEKCTNCKKDNDEERIDCGGPCPSCQDVQKKIVIENNPQLHSLSSNSNIMAFENITAKNNVTIIKNYDRCFITEETGSIVLLPGFTAKAGCTFTTQMKDLSKSSRECPVKLCSCAYIPPKCYRAWNAPPLMIHDLLHAEAIKYDIYDKQGKFLYGNKFDITHNGSVKLWDCQECPAIPQGSETYKILYTVTYCTKEKIDYKWEFVVVDNSGKSSTDDPDDPENPTPAFSPPANNTTHQEDNTVPNFSVTPNPNAGTFQLETNFPLSDIDHLKITNTVGAVVYESQHLVSNEIQLQNTAPGLYFVVMVLKEGTVLTQKVMVQR